MPENHDERRRRLIHRSRYTGMKETDLVLGQFAARYVPGFTPEQLDRYEQLLAAGDPTIYDWVTGTTKVPPAYDNDVTALLINFKISV